MNANQETGVLLLCIMCLVPFFIGATVGWALRGRHDALGFPGMLVPSFIRKIIERLL